jgi:tRNA threonylcarbamoyladenosine biosynthesis protein TsaE
MPDSFSLDLPSADSMVRLGEMIGSRVFEGAVIGLSGPLGAGKTTLTRGIAGGMGIEAGYVVSSPTYTILQVYPCGNMELFHLDLYRISSHDDLDSTGYRDGVGRGKVLVIEWADKLTEVLPHENLRIRVEYGPHGRTAVFTAEGEMYEKLADEVLAAARRAE